MESRTRKHHDGSDRAEELTKATDGPVARDARRPRTAHWFLLAAVGGAILLLTLTPSAEPSGNIPWCLRCAHFSARDLLLNIILFIPLGWSLALLGLSPRRAVAVAATASLGIEMLQWIVVAGRDASLLDVATNTIGAAAGTWIAQHARHLTSPARVTARVLVAVLALAWAGQLWLTAWALTPDLPDTHRYVAELVHVFPTTVPYTGVVESFSVNGILLADGTIEDQDSLRNSLLQSSAIHVRVIKGGRVPGRAQIAALVDGDGNLLTGIMQEGCDYRFIVRMRGERLGLNAPTAVRNGDCKRAGQPAELNGRGSRRSLALVVASETATDSAGVMLRSTSGWSLLAPFDGLLRRTAILGGAWVLVFALPLAWWLPRAGASRRQTMLLLGLTLAGGAQVSAWVTGLAGPSAIELLVVAACAFLGWSRGPVGAET